MCFSGKGQQTQTTQANPQAQQEYDAVMNQANQVASRPLQQYQGPMIAGFTPQQMSAFNEINGAQGAANPYLNTASQYYANANQPIAQEAQSNIAGFESPYTQQVVNSTQQQFTNQNAQQQAQVEGNAASSGAFGGDRQAVAQAQVAGQQQQAEAPVVAGLENQGFQSAEQAALQSAQAQGQLANQSGFGMGYLGNTAENTALQGASAQLQAGGLQQQLGQEELNIPYQQFQEAQQYPFQTTQWLGGLAEGLGGLMGGTSTLTGAGPSGMSELTGLGEAGLGAAGNAGGFGSLLGKATGGAVPYLDREGRAFGGDMLHMHRPHFPAMRMSGTHMPHPHMRPSMHIMSPMRHAGFGAGHMGLPGFGGGHMGAPGMGVPTGGPNAPMGGVPNAGASPVPGFAAGGIALAKGPSGVSYPVLPMPGNSGPVNVNPTFDYSPPSPSAWKSATAPGTGFSGLPVLQYHGGQVDPTMGGGIAGFGLPQIPQGFAAGGDTDDDDLDNDESFAASPQMMMAGFSGMGSMNGMGGFGGSSPMMGPQMMAPMMANAESEQMAGRHAPPLPLVPNAARSPVPAPMANPHRANLPHIGFREQPQGGNGSPIAGFGAVPSSGDSDIVNLGNVTGPGGISMPNMGREPQQAGFANPSSPWTALMNAGFATMAGRSPYALSNIGEGAMQGIQMWQAQKAAAQKQQQEQAQTGLDTTKAQTDNEKASTDAQRADTAAKALDALIARENKKMTDDESKNTTDASYKQGMLKARQAEVGRPQIQYIGNDQSGNAIGMDAHTGRKVNLGPLSAKPSAQTSSQFGSQKMPWEMPWTPQGRQ